MNLGDIIYLTSEDLPSSTNKAYVTLVVESKHLNYGLIDLRPSSTSTVSVTKLLLDGDVILGGRDGRFRTAVVPKWLELDLSMGPAAIALRLQDYPAELLAQYLNQRAIPAEIYTEAGWNIPLLKTLRIPPRDTAFNPAFYDDLNTRIL